MLDAVVSSDLYLTFSYVIGGVEELGKVEGDFTIEISKDGTGNQATTGTTITEIDATNNAGEYLITVAGATGFVSAVGTYKLVVFDTAAPEYRWTEEIRVSENGTATSSGIAFTATSGDGRVTGDATALQGATVRVKNSSDQIIYQTTTDASGIWGTVYLNDESSYTVHVQATGYTSTTATITTTGGAATGPGADVDISAASATTELQASVLWAYARRMAHDKVGVKATTQLKQAVNSALGMVGRAHQWPHLVKSGRINIRALSNDGTVTVTDDSTTVTLAGATWPSWVAGCEFVYDGIATAISTRDSDTQITLAHAFNGTTAAGASYTVYQYKYDLPDDCVQIGPVSGGAKFTQRAAFTDMATLEQQRHVLNFSNPDQYLWSAAAGSMAIWPYPSQDRMLNFTYYAKPADLTADSDTADWDIALLPLLHRAIDYQLSLTMGCAAGSTAQCKENFLQELKLSLPNDKSSARHDMKVGIPGDSLDRGSYTISSS